MNTPLTLDEFPKPSPGDWRQAAEEVLKGAPFEKKLVSKTFEGIDIQPIYDGSGPHAPPPGFGDYVRGTKAAPERWQIAQEIMCGGPKTFNEALRTDLERGQTAVRIVLDRASRHGLDPDVAAAGDVGICGLSLATMHDLDGALEGIDLSRYPLHIDPGSAALPVFALLIAALRHRQFAPEKLRGSLNFDPLGELVADSVFPSLPATAFDRMAQITTWAVRHMPAFRTIGVRTHVYHDAGAHAVQELAFALGTAVEYLRQMEERNILPDTAAARMQFAFSIGQDFFMAIAKFRAARLLWSRVAEGCGVGADGRRMVLHARTALASRSKLDPYVNILRGATEALAAVIGGCDSLHVGPFDEVLRAPDEFSRRLARNTQILLAEECALDRVMDPAGGSPYVETLTRQLAQKAWELFQEIERRGGMWKAVETGWPQEQVNAVHARRAESVAHRRTTLVGVNQYANPAETPFATGSEGSAEIHRKRTRQIADYRTSPGHIAETAVLGKLAELLESQPSEVADLAIEAAQHGATLGELARTLGSTSTGSTSAPALPVRRLADPFEKLREAVWRAGTAPKVFLANMGPIGQHKARADFATGFFRAGGFEVLDTPGFPDVAQAAEAALASGASVVVICSTDDTYPDLVPPLAQTLKARRPDLFVVVAGYPKEHLETFRQAGVDEFIHLRANCLEILTRTLQTVGVAL